MQPRVSLITLGVQDVAAARTFYERLGFKASSDSNADVAFFDAGGVALAIFGRAALAHDANCNDLISGFSGVTLAHNVSSEAEVDVVISEAIAAGARLTKPAAKTFWGGYSGYFSDLDGNIWEVAHNPFWPMDDSGRVILPGTVR